MGSHKETCQCVFCRCRRGIPHKVDCSCVPCRTKRGEYHLSDETRRKIGDANRNPSVETRKKVGDSKKEMVHKKNCQCMTCRSKPGDFRGEKAPFYGHKHSEELKKKNSDAHRGKMLTSEHKKRIGDSGRGKLRSAETKEKIRQATKRSWKNSAHAQKIMASLHASPNRPETLLFSVINEAATGFLFTGSGTKIIAGKCPDFVNEEKHLIIELFGDYWHEPEEVEPRIKLFESQGYQTLIIWERELKDPEVVLKKVKCFCGQQ